MVEKLKKQNRVNKNVVKNIRHEKYIDVLFNKKNDKTKNEKNSK